MTRSTFARCLAPMALAIAAGCSSPPPAPLPDLLVDATGPYGWSSACPPADERERAARGTQGLAVSPELDQRLATRFPPGTRESELTSTLLHDGFTMGGACASDASIRIANFWHTADFASIQTSAQVFWKVEGDGRIAWTKGFVRYTGP